MIIVRIWEGLGNQLFQYAYARALQLRTNQKVYIDINRTFKSILESHSVEREYELDKFHINIPVAKGIERRYAFLQQRNATEIIMNELSEKGILMPGFYRENENVYKQELKWISGNKYLMGWFQSEKYFAEYRNVLLREITPKNKIRISTRLRRVLENEKTISVHIRRTDYMKTNEVLPVSYYNNAIDYTRNKFENPYYIIFTDDIGWVRQNLDFGRNVIYVADEENLKDYEEMLIMSKCNHNIIANSTFSWWGAWLNRNDAKIVIGPKIWFKAQKTDIMPEKWLKF